MNKNTVVENNVVCTKAIVDYKKRNRIYKSLVKANRRGT